MSDEPAKRFPRTGLGEKIGIWWIEIHEIGGDFENPIWYRKHHCGDVNGRYLLSQEWTVLQPGDDIVQYP